ncbi:16615_t:CDS:1, partial [Dentiscutata erythropus]
DNKSVTRGGARKLPDDIADIINDSEFWSVLFKLQNILYPLCGFLNKLQKDTTRLYEVLHCFAYAIKLFSNHLNLEFGSKIVTCIEFRWKEWEQPLLILAFVLYPAYKLSQFHESVIDISWTHIGQWIKYYYKAWFESKPISILAELINYKREIDLYDIDSFKHFKGNLIDF